jgi:hypothetical protein
VNVNSLIIAYCEIVINRGVIIFADFVVCVRWYHTLQGDNSLKFSAKCIDPRVLEFVISNTTGNSQWGTCIWLDFIFCSLRWYHTLQVKFDLLV